MEHWKTLVPTEWTENTFSLFNDQWVLIAAEKDGKVNAMTASWGGLGVLWNEQVATIYVRASRYTREFLDAAQTFSLTVFDASYKPMLLETMGRKSGRDTEKMRESGLVVEHIGDTPVFAQARLALVCEKIYRHGFDQQGFIWREALEHNYGEGDFHILYIGKVLGVYGR